jgi:transposase
MPFVQPAKQVSIRAIARRTGLSRNTVRKYLTNGVVEPRYPKRNSRSNLDHFAEKLAGWLKAESSRGRKQRLSVKELYVRLRQLGYCGSYDRVCAFARRWRRAQQEAARTVGRGCSFLWCSRLEMRSSLTGARTGR